MRICSIKGSNLASLAGEFAIDFEAEPLKGAGLFAITGPTGAGKSTLLDALFLALFDATPRLAGASTATIGLESEEESQRLTSRDPKSVVRKGAAEGWAEVVFLGRDGRRYRATWRARRARNQPTGQFQPQTVSLEVVDTKQLLGERKTQTLEAISRSLGLTFDQFRRSVVLAQGEFAAFLRANRDERSQLLEDMTGAQIYTKVSMTVYERAKAEQEKLAQLQSQRQSQAPLTPEARQEREQARAVLESQLETTRRELESVKGEVQWFERCAELARDASGARLECQGAEKALEEAAPRRTWLERVQAAAELRGAFGAWQDTARRLAEVSGGLPAARTVQEQASLDLSQARARSAEALTAQTQAEAKQESARPELNQARVLDASLLDARAAVVAAQQQVQQAADRARSSEGDLARVDRELSQGVQQRETLEKELERLAGFRPLAMTWNTAKPAFVAACDKLTQARRMPLGKLPEENLPPVEALAQARAARDEAERQVTATRLAQAASQSALDGLDRPAIEAELTRLRGQRDALRELATALEEWERHRTAREGHARQLLEHQARAEQATARAQSLTLGELVVTRAAKEQAGISRAEVERVLGLVAHRDALRDGEPCPLCGSREHPTSNLEGAVQERLEQLKLEALRLETRERELLGEISQCEATARAEAELTRRSEREEGEATKSVALAAARFSTLR